MVNWVQNYNESGTRMIDMLSSYRKIRLANQRMEVMSRVHIPNSIVESYYDVKFHKL